MVKVFSDAEKPAADSVFLTSYLLSLTFYWG